MAAIRNVAVIDIGKTNAKLALVNLDARCEIAVITRANRVLDGPPYPHFDVDAHWEFMLDGMTKMQAEFGIDAISITTHGACAALLAQDGTLAAPVLDYEHSGPDELSKAYNLIRPAFDETGSPRLPMGLNVGAQLYWQFSRDPGLLARVVHIVTWPQYWGHRLTGNYASDVTSLGCHTDLWNPYTGQFSSLVQRLGIADKMAPALNPGAVLGAITPAIAARTGLPLKTPVACGIHDSNASLLPHLHDRDGAYSVVSTGTWVVVMTNGARQIKLDPARDTLVNVNAFGQPVSSSRFMGGREYEIIRNGRPPLAGEEDAARVLANGIMLLPAVQSGCGPFPESRMAWVPSQGPTDDAEREVALGYYLAMMTAQCLSIVGAQGPSIIEGPFARNPFFRDMLKAATGRSVLISESQTGTAIGAALLFAPAAQKSADSSQAVEPINPALLAYAKKWQSEVA